MVFHKVQLSSLDIFCSLLTVQSFLSDIFNICYQFCILIFVSLAYSFHYSIGLDDCSPFKRFSTGFIA